jgi:1,2-diacylglycerol 3-alpha-glucosyltransferase
LNILLASYYYKPHFGGVENSLYALALEYKKSGDQVLIIASDAALDKSKRLPKYEVIDDVAVYRFRHFIPWLGAFHIFAPLYDIISSYCLIRKLTKSKRIDYYIVRHYILAMALALFRPSRTSYLLPGLVKFQDTLELKQNGQSLKQKMVNSYRYFFIMKQQVWIQNYAIRRIPYLYVFSHMMVRQVIQSAGSKVMHKIRQVKPGLDLNRFKSGNKSMLKENKKWNVNDFVFLSVGRLTVHKGLDIAIDAFSILLNKYKDKGLKLMIVGDGPELQKLINLSIERQLDKESVIFEHRSDHPEEYYQLADAFMMTSISETFGQTIIEAMACGLPVVAFHSNDPVTTATSQIVIPDKHGILCEYSAQALAHAMEEIFLWDKAKRQEVTFACEEEVRAVYSWTKLSAQLVNLD